jgi:hypothetical protein
MSTNSINCSGIMLNTASNSVSRMSSKALQLYLDEKITKFKKSAWIGTLVLENISIVNDFEPDESDKSATGTIDICQYLPGGTHQRDIDPVRTKLRFDSSIFPPSESDKAAFESSNPTYIRLRETLQRAAIQCGYSIVPKSGARFMCKCGRTYANGRTTTTRSLTAGDNISKSGDNIATLDDKENNDALPLFRKVSWQYDRKNSRKKGLEPLIRNTSTSLPMKYDEICKTISQ